MCTLTWRQTDGGFSLLMNRDELYSRGHAEPPQVHEIDGVPVLAPVDTDAGGTWISVNGEGVALCLLNRYPRGKESRTPPVRQSRGLLVLRYASAADVGRVETQLRRDDLRRYAPFTLLVMAPGTKPCVRQWDGYHLEQVAATPPLTSSSFDTENVCAARRQTYRQLVGDTPSLEELRAYHESHLPAAGPYSVCTHREDGETRSLTEIHVTPAEVRMEYIAGPPCRTNAGVTKTLQRSGL